MCCSNYTVGKTLTAKVMLSIEGPDYIGSKRRRAWGEGMLKKRFLVNSFLWIVASVLYFTGGQALAQSVVTADSTYVLSDVKIFPLAERDVVAIGVEARIPTGTIIDPLHYKLELAYREIVQGDRMEVVVSGVNNSLSKVANESVIETKVINDRYLKQIIIDKSNINDLKIQTTFPGNVKTKITTVKRKPIVNSDGTTTFRTYLVLEFLSPTAHSQTIVVDPGHGGKDSGAVNNFLCEKDLNLMIAVLAGDLFRQKGYDVYMTRTDDTFIPLLDRADAANILNAAAFVSVHNNSVPTDMSESAKKLYRGTTVLYNSSALRPAKELAMIMCDELVNTLRTHQYPLQDRPGLVVLNSTWVPAVIAEVSMMPHPQDAKMISQPIYQQKAAEAIVSATDKYLKKIVQTEVPINITPSNAVNHGLGIVKGDFIYYIEQIGDTYAGCSEQIVKIDKNSGTKQILSTDEAWDLNIDGDWLYYSNWSDGHRIYKMKTDGTEKTGISDDAASHLTVVADGIMYIKWSNSGAKDNFIYKISFDGQEKKLLSKNPADNLSIVDEWAYYSNRADGYRPYRIRLDGTGEQKISDQTIFFMAVAKDWIYYSHYADGGKLYKMKVDGTGSSKVTDDKVGFITIMGDWIYYTNSSDGDMLYRVKKDGSGRNKMYNSNGAPMPITIIDGKIYYNGQFL